MSADDPKQSHLGYEENGDGGYPSGDLQADDTRRHSSSYFELGRQGGGGEQGNPGYNNAYPRNSHIQPPLTQQHTGPPAFFNMHRADSPGFGSSLMPSYGSAPSLSHMQAFANMNLSNPQSQAHTGATGGAYNMGPGSDFNLASTSAGGGGGLSGDGGMGYHSYTDPQSSRHMRARALSSPGPGSSNSQPGSVSPVFSAADISPTNSVYSSRAPPSLSYTTSTDQSTVTPTHLALGPSMISGGGSGGVAYPPPPPGMGLGMVGGHPYVIGGARYPPGALPRNVVRREGEAGGSGERREGGGDMSPPNAMGDPRRREDVRIDARRARIESEQRRRDELREGFKRLKETLPQSAQRASKSSLLDRAITHITQIESANVYLHEANQRILAENEKLRDANHKLVAAQTQTMSYGRDPSDGTTESSFLR